MILLDSHVFYWWTTDNPQLSRGARAAIEDASSEVGISAVVAWEIASKVRSGKWPEARILSERFFETVQRYHFTLLPITAEHAHLAGSMAGRHRDPFDRMLAAQSQIENVPLVTADPVFRAFRTRVLW